MRIKEAHLNRGLVALPPGSKINAHNGVLLPLTASPVLKAQNKTELRTVKIGYYDAESKYMYPILENYRAYVKPGYTVPDGVEPVTLESPSPVSPIYKLEEDKSVSANAEQIRADIAEARENGTEVDVPDYAYISPKGIISMYEYDSPYEEYRHREGITRIGFYDEETGKMLVLDDWRCPYSDFVDKTYESKREKRRKEKAREESIEVDIPDYARITVSDYWYRNGFSCVVIREKDSPYPEYRDSDLYVRIGKYNEETMRMHPEPNYYRYLNREAAVDYPSNRYMPSEDGLVPVPPFAKLWKTGVYCIQRNMSPNRIITTLGGSLKVGLPSEHEGMMVPLPDYEAACIENAPVREEMIHVSEQTFGQMLEEKRQKELTIFDDRECYVYPGYSLIAYRFFVESGIDQILRELYGPIAANRIETLAADHAKEGRLDLNTDYAINMPYFRVKMDSPDTLEFLRQLEKQGTKQFYDRWMKLHENAEPYVVENMIRADIYGMDDAIRKGIFYEDVRDEEIHVPGAVLYYDRKTDHYLGYGLQNFQYYIHNDHCGSLQMAADEMQYEILKHANPVYTLVDHADNESVLRDYEYAGSMTLCLYPLDSRIAAHFKKVEGKLVTEEYRLKRFDEYATVMPCEICGIKGQLMIGISPIYRSNLLKYGAREYLNSLKRGLQNLPKSSARVNRSQKYFTFESGGESDRIFYHHEYNCHVRINKGAAKEFEREAGYYAVFTTNMSMSVDDLVQLHYAMNVNYGFFYNRFHCSYFEGLQEDPLKRGTKALYMINLIARNLQAYLGNKLAFDQKDMSYDDQIACFTKIRVAWNAGNPRFKYTPDEDGTRLLELFGLTEKDLLAYAEQCYRTENYFASDVGFDENWDGTGTVGDYKWPMVDEAFFDGEEDLEREPPRSHMEIHFW